MKVRLTFRSLICADFNLLGTLVKIDNDGVRMVTDGAEGTSLFEFSDKDLVKVELLP